MVWGLCYKLTTIKNSQVGRYDSTKKYNFAAKVPLANSLSRECLSKSVSWGKPYSMESYSHIVRSVRIL